jgi:signal transduction histidine kinase
VFSNALRTVDEPDVWYDIGLIASVAIGGWLALDVAMAEQWRRRSISLGVMGATGALWASSELLLRVADEAWEFALLRRLLYLAVAGATFAWYWVAVEADSPRWFRDRRWQAALPLIPLAFTWSSLWWAPDGTVISLYTEEPAHGPFWFAAAGTSWALISAGLFHYGRATLRLRLRRRDQVRAYVLAVGIALPLILNIAYALGWFAVDPAPCLLGPAALLIRFGVIDIGLALYLPLAQRDVIEQLEVGVVVASLDGAVLDANASATRLLGGTETRGRNLDDLTAQLEPGIEVLRFPLESHFSQTGMAAVLTDRRDAIEAEGRLQLAGRLEAIGSLTAGIAHEVNNPLAYICANLNSVEKLVAELNGPQTRALLSPELQRLAEDGADCLADAQEGFERISMLVARLKGFARRPQGEESDKPLDVAAIARSAASMAGVGLHEDAIHIRSSDRTLVCGSDDAVTQILVNLLLNAVQASQGGPQIEVDVLDRESELEVRVSDRGHGIDEEAFGQIFDPFFTTKHTGSGLGLSISFDLARRLGGRIEAANRKDGGAVFSLFLPATARPA